MNANRLGQCAIAGAVLITLAGHAAAVTTALSSAPITSSSGISAKPNILFVLDDSGSMNGDFLPDWAGPYQATISSVLTVVTPRHRFFNSAYNGVAYNPGTRYRPPLMYTNTGALDTTTYPGQTGQSAATGGDGSASAGLPNWRAVKVDGYGVQSAATVNLEGNAFSYTAVAGEYCDSVQLRNCVAAASPAGAYTFPAKLRWCTTSAMAVDTTANAATNCQASNIDDSAANLANGVTPYTFARFPAPRSATLTVVAAGTVSAISVDSVQILFSSASGATSTDLATDIVAKINACTYGAASGPCTAVGYSAFSLADVVTVIAPNASTSTPAVTLASGGPVTPTAFSGGNVPGASLLAVITPLRDAYAYPGALVKSANRSDCAASTCTYVEEMTNYANWYAYYRTRMQMMKTASSIAFSSVDNNFRVGYYSINNGAGSQFLNLDAFDGAQKNLWYSKFFAALPFGATPLRTGLANAGKLYARKLASLNDVSADDPMQYACQQNFTILSTDGYWNDIVNPTQLDGTTEIGEQDGSDPRPYYDGGSQTRTVSQTEKSELQVGINTWLVESRTQQQQTVVSRLTQSVLTVDTYPWTTQTSTLQTQITPLDKTDYALVQSSYALTSVTKQLQESTFKLNSTPRILQSYTYNLTQTTTPLQEKVYNITSVTTPLQEKVFNITSVTTPLQEKVFNITSVTTPLQEKVFNITSVTTPLQEKVFNITSVTTPLQSTTTLVQSSTRQLQQNNEYSTDGGDTWQSTGWVNVSACVVRASGPGWIRNTQCRYNTPVVVGGLSSCSTVAVSVAPNYTVAQAVTCAYETTSTLATVSSCTAAAPSASSPYLPAVSCAYSGTPVTLSNETSCTAVAASTGNPYTGPMRSCTFNASAATTTTVTSCTAVTPANAATPKYTCTYTGTPVTLSNETSCTAVAASTGNPYAGPMRTCAFNATAATTTDVTTCNTLTPANAASPKHTCGYTGTPVTLSNETACTAVAASGGNPYSGPKRSCAFNATAATTTDVTSCTVVTPANAATPKHTCGYTGTPVTLANETSCTAVAASGGSPYAGPMRSCAFNASAASTTTVTSCTAVTPANAATPKHTCGYTGTPVTLSNETTCTAVAASGGSPYSGPMRSCAFNAAPASTTNVTTCTAVTPANAATPQHTCTYTGTPTVVNNLTTCTAVAPSTSNPYTGPAVSCAYMAAVVATNLTTCTAGAPSAGPVYAAYTTCGYVNGTTTTGLNSCTYVADSPGPVYSGPANACAYSGTASVVNVTSCTPVAQDLVNFAAPQKSCAYEAVGTPATNLANYTAVPQSGGAPYTGPNVSCAYAASPTLSSPGSCTVNVEAGPSYTSGAKISCGYAAGVTTSNVGTCTVQAQQLATADATVYAPATDCAYGAVTPLVDATGACVPQAQSLTSPYAGPARNCQYTAWSADTYAGTCVNAAQNNSNLTARNCVATPFPVTISTLDTTVDSCSTDPTSAVSPVDAAATRSTATTCTYLTPLAASNSATCTPHAADASSPYASAVMCPVSDSGYVAVAPACTPTAPPATFDASGKIVDCRTTDTTPYTPDYPSGAVPVAACTPGIDPVSKAQTACTTLLSTGPAPVDPATCVTVTPVAPNFVATSCATSATSATVMGCEAPAPSAPLWQTVSCVDDGTGTSNTLADVAAYYYKTDLRTPALGNCSGAIVPPATTASVLCSASDAMNIVRTSPADPNPAQHMTTFTLGLGASGYMKYSNTYGTDAAGDFPTVKGVSPFRPIDGITANPGAGLCTWQSGGLCNWPYPSADAQNTIDDLWHAAVNGHGVYYSAGDPASLAAGISSALNGVAGAGGSAAAPSVSTANLNPSDNYVFSSSYATSEWTGDVVRRRINPYTGVPLSTTDWSAQAKLDANTARNIYTFDSITATAVAFTSANFAANANFNTPNISTSPVGLTQFLCASADICLSAADQTSAAGANLVNYLRGERSNEGIETDNSKYYRQRQHVLGDLVNAQTVYVNHPTRDFGDPGYAAFRSAQANRQAVVYAGANDGMLHAFAAKGTAATEALVDAYAAAAAASAANSASAALLSAANGAAAAAAAALAADPTIGQELWAYIPSMVLSNLYKLADKKYRDKHRYFVDATPVVGDICVSNCANAATAVWKTLLVGGLGHGGRGFYALDITTPGTAPVALWEFTDANLGFSYGNPQIAKLADGRWVVMLTSGYNNGSGDGGSGDGVGRLYVLNAATGAQITGLSPISTGYGDPDDPSGLTNISAMVVDPQTDSTSVAVYGGDLAGNLWRFDVNDTVGPDGFEAQLLAVLEDAAGNPQPITSKPAVSVISNQKVVFIGTGRFLDASDSSDTSAQSVYAIKDPWTLGGTAATALFTNPGGDRTASARNSAGFVPQSLSWVPCPLGSATSLCVADTQVMAPTGGIVNAVDFVADNGWFIDLINPSERANTNPALALGLLAFVSNAPSLLACDIGGKSYLYFLNYLNGGPIVSPDNPGGLTGYLIGNTFASGPTIVVRATPDGGVGRPEVIFGVQDPSKVIAPVNCIGNVCGVTPPILPEESRARRTSWREVIAE